MEKFMECFFFGLFTSRGNPAASTGLYYHNYENGEEITNEGTFLSNSYVMAQHYKNPEHDITVDGFYTNYNQDGKIRVNYVGVTPEDDVFYTWLVGESVKAQVFEVNLTASKFATLGTYELLLQGFSTPNTKFTIIGFSANLNPGISLVGTNEIDSIAENEQIANSVFGLTMETGNTGWQTKGLTTFLTESRRSSRWYKRF